MPEPAKETKLSTILVGLGLLGLVQLIGDLFFLGNTHVRRGRDYFPLRIRR